MSTEKQSKDLPYPVVAVIGVVLVLAGAYFTPTLSAMAEPLVKMGIPLDPGTTLATIGVFIILFPSIKYFFLNPLSEAIHNRNSELERTFTEVEDLRSEMQRMRSEYEQRLAATEAQARDQIQNQIREAQQLRQTLMAEAASRADALVERAQVEIASERDRLIVELRTQVVDITLAAAEKVIGENLNDARNRKLVEDFIDRVEVAR